MLIAHIPLNLYVSHNLPTLSLFIYIYIYISDYTDNIFLLAVTPVHAESLLQIWIRQYKAFVST